MSLDVSVIYPQKHELYLTSPLGDCTSRNIWIIHRVKCVTILFVTVNDIHREIHQISFVTLFRLHLVHVVCFGDTAAGLLTFYYELRQFWPSVADRLNEFFFLVHKFLCFFVSPMFLAYVRFIRMRTGRLMYKNKHTSAWKNGLYSLPISIHERGARNPIT